MRALNGVFFDCLTIVCACAAASTALAQESEPASTEPVVVGERAATLSLDAIMSGDALTRDAGAESEDQFVFESRAAAARAGLGDTFNGDIFAAGVLAENSEIAVLIDDPNKNIFTFNGLFQGGGQQFYTESPTSVAAFIDQLGGGTVYQVTVAAVTDDVSDWLPSGLSYQGNPLTTLRMDVGMRTADFFNMIGADAPIQPTNGASIQVLSAAFGLFSGNQFLGAVPLVFANFSNGLAGVAGVAGADGANITELQMIFVVRISEPVAPCPPPVEVAIWPNDNKFTTIDLNEVVPDNIPGVDRTYEILSITQDEPVGPDGCDADGVGSDVASIRIQRAGWGNGRVYTINYQRAALGGVCTGVIKVGVPHDQSDKKVAIDDGQDYDSTACSVAGDVNVDGAVDSADLAAMLSQWRDVSPKSYGDPVFSGDVNEDGRVNSEDLVILLANYGLRADLH
jgi:hypothetical protein